MNGVVQVWLFIACIAITICLLVTLLIFIITPSPPCHAPKVERVLFGTHFCGHNQT